MPESKQYRLVKGTRWIAQVIGLSATGCLLLVIAEVLGAGLQPITIEGILLSVFGAMALAGCILSWWRERLAGILLVSTAAGLGVYISLVAGRLHLLLWAIVGLPLFVAGILLLNFWWFSRKTLRSGRSP